ncbi:MAG: hypothetical protein CM15mP58_20230 [Burkholderiaceae bacterium]|nr:MAG: hypothetical protein CM15mP58_20230 [Burkholderiaceae bacterium]
MIFKGSFNANYVDFAEKLISEREYGNYPHLQILHVNLTHSDKVILGEKQIKF